VYPWSWNIGLSALEDDAHNNASIAVALKSTKSYKELEAIANKLAESLREGDVLKEVRSDLDMNQKAFSIEIEREPAAALGIDEKAISLALQIFSDRMRPSEFKLEGMRYPVYLQSNIMSDDLSSIYISAKDGTQVPLSTVAKVKKNVEASSLKHLDQMRTATVLANLGEKMSLGEAQRYLDKVIKEVVPPDVSVSFEGALAMQEKSSKTFFMLFLAGLIFIFAIMAIQFEGIINPLIILVTVPLALIGAVFLLWITKTDTNLYTQVGMLTLIGLITKHGILLTEFVSHHRASGMAIKEAIFMAAKWRFRPIVMTTLATVFGALPLIISSGAGVEARASIGLVIVGGMIFGTLLTLFVLPALILTIYNVKEKIWSNNEI
jgi:multidrug efflux pump